MTGPGPQDAPDLEGLEALFVAGMRVLRYPHETEPDEDGSTREWTCDVLAADGVPAPGFTTYATSGVRVHSTNLSTEDGRRMRTELVMAGRSGEPRVADVLDACALAVATGSLQVRPGTVVPSAVEFVDDAPACAHVLLAPPFLWPELVVVEDRADEDGEFVLTRLQAVPITTAELTLASEKGHEALFAALEEARADVTNLDRPSVV